MWFEPSSTVCRVKTPELKNPPNPLTIMNVVKFQHLNPKQLVIFVLPLFYKNRNALPKHIGPGLMHSEFDKYVGIIGLKCLRYLEILLVFQFYNFFLIEIVSQSWRK